MPAVLDSTLAPKLIKVLAAIIVGASLSTAVSSTPVTFPGTGPLPALAVGTVGLAFGGILYWRVPALLGSTGCGCGGDCDCA